MLRGCRCHRAGGNESARGCQLRPNSSHCVDTPNSKPHLMVARGTMVDADMCVGSFRQWVGDACGVHISPHRHTGNSLKPGTRKRSNADMIPHRVGKSAASALRSFAVAVCSKLLTWIARMKPLHSKMAAIISPIAPLTRSLIQSLWRRGLRPSLMSSRTASLSVWHQNWSADRPALGAIER